MHAAGITRVSVEFKGEDDSGQINYVIAYSGDKEMSFPDTEITLAFASWGAQGTSEHNKPIEEAVEDLCYGYLEQEHGGWENNDGAYGEFTFDVAERTIALDFYGRYTDYTHSTQKW